MCFVFSLPVGVVSVKTFVYSSKPHSTSPHSRVGFVCVIQLISKILDALNFAFIRTECLIMESERRVLWRCLAVFLLFHEESDKVNNIMKTKHGEELCNFAFQQKGCETTRGRGGDGKPEKWQNKQFSFELFFAAFFLSRWRRRWSHKTTIEYDWNWVFLSWWIPNIICECAVYYWVRRMMKRSTL